MKIKELFIGSNKEGFFGSAQTSGGQGRTASSIGTGKFRLTLDKSKVVTPIYRMDKVLQMLEDRPNLASGVRQMTLFLLNDIKFKSDDEKSQEFAMEWLKDRRNIKEHMQNFTSLLIACGTSYFEPTFVESKKNGKRLDNIFSVPDPSILVRNLFAKDESEYWLMMLPFDVRTYGDQPAKFYPVTFIKGSYLYRDFVWAIPLHKNKFYAKTFGWSRDGMYGSGLLGCAVDNVDIEREILKNWALVAKYRALGKKIIGFFGKDDEPVDMPELDRIKQEFNTLEEEDSLLVNRQVSSTDLTFTGQDNSMDAQIEFLRKDSGSSLVPNYMTAFSQDSAYATAQEAKVPFSLLLKSIQEELITFFNEVITEQLKKEYTFLAEDLTIELGTPELYSRNDVFNMISQLYNNRQATINEYRMAAGLNKVEGGDKWGSDIPLDNTSVSIKPDDQKPKQLSEKYKSDRQFTEALKTSKAVFREAGFRSLAFKEDLVNELNNMNGEYSENLDNKFKSALSEFLKNPKKQ